jgi:hypothetical protein
MAGPHEGAFAVVTTMKNEGAFLVEWVAHYRALGFDRMLICTNDCADPTRAMAVRLQAMGLARHHATRHWPTTSIQRSALKQATRYPEVTGAGWIFVCDADEFLVVKSGDGSVRELARLACGHRVVTVPWRVFGPDGATAFDDRPVTAQFTRAEAAAGARRGTYGKSLFAGLAGVHRIGIHGPVAKPDGEAALTRCLPGGRDCGRFGHPLLVAPEWTLAQVNHYALRSRDSFLVKRERGRVNHSGQDMGLDYWRRFDRAEERCDAIRRYDDAVAGWRDRLLADAELAALHRAAVTWHRDRIAALSARPESQALVAAIAGVAA